MAHANDVWLQSGIFAHEAYQLPYLMDDVRIALCAAGGYAQTGQYFRVFLAVQDNPLDFGAPHINTPKWFHRYVIFVINILDKFYVPTCNEIKFYRPYFKPFYTCFIRLVARGIIKGAKRPFFAHTVPFFGHLRQLDSLKKPSYG